MYISIKPIKSIYVKSAYKRHCSLLFAFFFIFLYNASAQNTLKGTVTTVNNTPIIHTSIVINDLKKGTFSNKDGAYTLTSLPSGTYLVSFTAEGFQTQLQQITINQTTYFNCRLAPKIADLPEVVVTGVAGPIDNKSNPASVSIITSENLSQTASTNIIDKLTNTPGVSAVTTGPAIAKPVIRGLGNNRVIVMNDGVKQEGQQWNEEFGVEIDEYAVDKVEILKGPATLSYGSDALAGVVNFLSTDKILEGSYDKFSGSVVTNYQSNNGLLAASINLGGNANGLLWNFIYTNKKAHDYKNKYDGPVWNSAYGESNAKLSLGINKKWGYTFLTGSIYDLKMSEIEGTRDSATGQFTTHYLSDDGEDSLGIAPANFYKKYNYYPIFHQSVRHYKTVLDNRVAIGKGQLLFKLGYQANSRREANDITIGDVYNSNLFLQTISYDLQYLLHGKSSRWSLGVNGMVQNSKNKGTVFIIPDYNSFDIGAFTIYQKTFNRLTLSGGLRYDARKLRTFDLYTDSSGDKSSPSEDDAIHRFTAFKTNFHSITGSIGAAYNISSFTIKANLSRGYRAPGIAETSSDGMQDDGAVYYKIGDPHLKPEESLQLDATLAYTGKDISIVATPFVNKISHYIFLSKLSSVDGGDSIRTDVVANLTGPAYKYVSGDALLAGGEITFNLHPDNISWLQWENGFSYVSAVQQNQDDSSKYLPNTPPAKLQSYFRFSFNKPSRFLNNLYFTVGADKYFDQNKAYLKFDTETPTKGYTLLNASAGVTFNGKKRDILSLHLNINNIADVAYQSHLSRLKYFGENYVTGRTGVFNMGRNVSIKVIVPF